jgi:DNA polymerase-1
MRRSNKKVEGVGDFDKRAANYFPKKRHDTGAPVCLIVDGTNIAYQAFYAYSQLSFQGKSTAILFGMPTILATILKSYKAEKVVVCWDGVKSPHRMELLPEYKSHREKGRDPISRKKFLKQIRSTQALLKKLGITQAYNPKMEGDDMVYWMVKKFSPLYRIVIASADKDMHQLINYDVTVYNPRTKIPYSNFAYVCDNLVEPYQFIDYLCLVGDSSDDIPGYRGIGPAKAAAFFKGFKGIKDYLESDREVAGLMDKDKLKEVWERNRLMIDLKLFNERYYSMNDATFYKNKRSPQFNKEKFEAQCNKYGLKTMLTETFQRPFKELSNA